MITLDCEQGSQEWIDARLGIVTASEIHNIISPNGTKTVSTTSNQYMNKLLAEYKSRKSEDDFSNKYMEAGKVMEEEARDYLAFNRGVEISEVGMVYLDDKKLVAASPDGLISTDNGCEIKCPKGSTQVAYLLAGKLPTFYIPQVQSAMWITGRENWTFMSYHEDLPKLIVDVEIDPVFVKQMQMMVSDFIGKMLIKREKLDTL